MSPDPLDWSAYDNHCNQSGGIRNGEPPLETWRVRPGLISQSGKPHTKDMALFVGLHYRFACGVRTFTGADAIQRVSALWK